MIRLKYVFTFLLFVFLLSSCFVHAPRYTTLDKVLDLKLGMTKEEVSLALNSKPYNFKLLTDTASILLYKYRVNDRSVLSPLMKENNGKTIKGKYVNLLVTYDKNGVSKKFESCSDCDETIIEAKTFDINKIVTFLTVTLPVVLVFLGIKFGTSTM